MTWLTVWRMTRPGFLLVTAVACLLGQATALSSGIALSTPKALASIVLAVLTHAAANVINDYYDALSGADEINTQGLFPFTGGARLIQNGEVSPGFTLQLALALCAVLIPSGMLLAWHSGPGLIGFGLAGIAIAWAYSAPPLALMSRGWGEFTVAMVWWLVVMGADYTLRGQLALPPIWAGAAFALLIGNILLINEFPDASADAKVGKRTLVVRLGTAIAARLYLGTVVVAHGVLGWAVSMKHLPSLAWIGLVSLPISIAGAVSLWRHHEHPASLRTAIMLTITSANVHGLALAAALFIASCTTG